MRSKGPSHSIYLSATCPQLEHKLNFKQGRSLMGDDNKTVRSKNNNLTVLCENLWPILYYLGGPLLALSSSSSRMYRKSTDKLLCEVCSLSPF